MGAGLEVMFTRRISLVVVAACVALVACDEPCSDTGTDLGCDDSLAIRFSEPLELPGRYVIALSGSRNSSCAFDRPAGLEASSDCPRDTPLIENGAVAGLLVDGAVQGTLTLRLSRDDQILLERTFSPSYEHSQSSCGPRCSTGTAEIDTAGLEPSSVGGDGGAPGPTDGTSVGGSDGGMAGGGAQPAGCERADWTGSYTAKAEALSSNCPALPDREWEFVDGEEQSLFCTVDSVEWSTNSCTRTSSLDCQGEGSSYRWDLSLSQDEGEPTRLSGTGHLSVTGEVACKGDYSLVYTRAP